MWVLPLLGYIGIVAGFIFLTLAIASGLYYLSELVEEHTVISRRILLRLIQFIVALHVLLAVFDGFPLLLTLFSAASHAAYGMNMRKFPMVSLTDGWFIGSCVLVIVNHLLWFQHFSNPQNANRKFTEPSSASARHKYTYSVTDIGPSFSEISAFFGICVWLVPFSLFVSLSASENVLPSTAGTGSDGMVGLDPSSSSSSDGKGRKKGRTSILNTAIQKSWEWIAETAGAMGIGGSRTGRRGSSF